MALLLLVCVKGENLCLLLFASLSPLFNLFNGGMARQRRVTGAEHKDLTDKSSVTFSERFLKYVDIIYI